MLYKYCNTLIVEGWGLNPNGSNIYVHTVNGDDGCEDRNYSATPIDGTEEI